MIAFLLTISAMLEMYKLHVTILEPARKTSKPLVEVAVLAAVTQKILTKPTNPPERFTLASYRSTFEITHYTTIMSFLAKQAAANRTLGTGVRQIVNTCTEMTSLSTF
jgi:hypothetical protein